MAEVTKTKKAKVAAANPARELKRGIIPRARIRRADPAASHGASSSGAKPAKPRVAKAKVQKVAAAPKAPSMVAPSGTYIYAIGGRKQARAVVRLYQGGKGVRTVNSRPFANYFATEDLRTIAEAPLVATGMLDSVDIVARATGGGSRGQAEAMRHALARAVSIVEPSVRPTMRSKGFLTRDSRQKERKKYGLKKARRAPQWGKR